MPPINLDEIIHYRPSTEKRFLKPVDAPPFHPRVYSELSSDGPISIHPFPPSPDLPGQYGNWFQHDGQYKSDSVPTSQYSVELDSAKQFTASSSSSAYYGLGPEIVAIESQNQALPFTSADQVAIDGGILRQPIPTVECVDTADNEQIVVPSGKEMHDPQTHLPSVDLHLPTGGVGIESNELISKSPIRTAEGRLDTAEYDNQSIAERYERMDHGADEVAAPNAEGRPQRSDERGPSASYQPGQNRPLARSVSAAFRDGEKQSPCSQPKVEAGFRSMVERRPSTASTNLRSQEREMRNSALSPLSPQIARPNKKRDRSEPSHDDNSSGDPDDPEDADYVCENTVSSRRFKRARQAAVRPAPSRPRRNAIRPSVDEAAQDKAVKDQSPLSSLSDIETIPIRGFLTRQILLSKVVYSVTFEEKAEHLCSHGSVEALSYCENEVASRRKEQPHRKKSCTRKPTGPTRFLSEDDQLLVELKEERGLPWKRIAEYFPERSKGALQVRYCTRLKGRYVGSSESSYKAKDKSSRGGISCEASRPSRGFQVSDNKSKDANGLSKQRYGAPRRRQPVNRYSPV